MAGSESRSTGLSCNSALWSAQKVSETCARRFSGHLRQGTSFSGEAAHQGCTPSLGSPPAAPQGDSVCCGLYSAQCHKKPGFSFFSRPRIDLRQLWLPLYCADPGGSGDGGGARLRGGSHWSRSRTRGDVVAGCPYCSSFSWQGCAWAYSGFVCVSLAIEGRRRPSRSFGLLALRSQ